MVEPGDGTPGNSGHVALKIRLTTDDAHGAGTIREADAEVSPRRGAVIALPRTAAPREQVVLVVPYLAGAGT